MNARPKILIVDDEEINQVYLESFLVSKYDVYTCGSVENYYRLIVSVKFDLIFMDISLRDIKDGLQLTKELKNSPYYHDVPVIILSSNNSRKTLDEAIEAGANKYFEKTVDRKTLLGCTEEFLNNSKTVHTA